jgi:hypothetical protein
MSLNVKEQILTRSEITYATCAINPRVGEVLLVRYVLKLDGADTDKVRDHIYHQCDFTKCWRSAF